MKSEIQILTSFSPACLFSVVSSLYIWSRLLDHFIMNIQTIYNNKKKVVPTVRIAHMPLLGEAKIIA